MMSSRIIIKQLPKDIDKEKLVAHIKQVYPSADVTDCNLKFTRDGVFRRFAFVGFTTQKEADIAHKKLHATFIRTNKIQVALASDVADPKPKSWSKYSKNKNLSKTEIEDETKAQSIVAKEKQDGYVIKMRGLSGLYSEKTVRDFFKPIKVIDVRIPRNAQKKPIGIAFAEFSTEKDQDLAMGRNKNFINDKKVFLKKSNEEMKKAPAPSPALWEVKSQASTSQEVESIADSGRLFVRNLYFGVTETELEELFGKYGPLAEVTLPVDSLTKKVKGFAHIVYVFPEHALQAYTALDYSSLHGRLMHILPGKESSTDNQSNEKSSFKKQKDKQQKSNNSNSYNWNTLFLGANAVADAMASRYNTDKSDILDMDSKSSLGVRLALGETQIVAETRKFLIANGVALDTFSQAAGERSKTVILVKNLPSGTELEDLHEVFGKQGSVVRLVMPPGGITALVEYSDTTEAKQAFSKLNFSKYKSIPLYLEWAPMGVFTKAAEIKEEDAESETKKETEDEESLEKDEVTEEMEEGSSIFVKNLNFETTDEKLLEHFQHVGKIHSATVAKKKDPNLAGNLLSMGYGFVQFYKKADAKEALKVLQNSQLDDHNLELKISNKTVNTKSGRQKQSETKQTSTKILVRNIPFEAKKKEIQELFQVFGELKFVRLPKKMSGTGPHRGFAFVDFMTKQDAKRAFDALCHSTHLYGRRLVLEWAEAEESLDELRRKTAQHFLDDGPKKKVRKTDILKEME